LSRRLVCEDAADLSRFGVMLMVLAIFLVFLIGLIYDAVFVTTGFLRYDDDCFCDEYDIIEDAFVTTFLAGDAFVLLLLLVK